MIVLNVHEVAYNSSHRRLTPCKQIEHTLTTDKSGNVNPALLRMAHQRGIPVILRLVIGVSILTLSLMFGLRLHCKHNGALTR